MHRQSASRGGGRQRLFKSRRKGVSPANARLRRLVVESLEDRRLLNAAPIAAVDAYSVGESEVRVVAAPGVLANDSDPDPGDVLRVSDVNTTGTLGIVAMNPNGSFAYDPVGKFNQLHAGQTGTDTFGYTVTDDKGGTGNATVTITILGNDPPVAVDDAYAANEDAPLHAAAPGVLANDTDPGDTLVVSGVGTGGTTGKVTLSADGSLTYDPNGKFDGLAVDETTRDSFTYTVSDGKGGSDTATVDITISGVNDAPVAADNSYATNENTLLNVAVNLGLLANDSDPDTSDVLTVNNVNTTGTKGAVTAYADGHFTYNPNGKFESLAVGQTATDTFTYTVSDGKGGTDTATVTITIDGVNDAPVANDDARATDEDTLLSVPAVSGLLANDNDPDTSDVLTVSGVDTTGTLGAVTWNANGSFTYNPNGKFNELQAGDSATDTFTYTISDGHGGTDTAIVTLTISGLPNISPVANNDAYETYEDEFLLVSAPGLLANDTDSNPSDVLSVTSVDRTGTTGLVVVHPNGSLAYDPFGKFSSLTAGQTATDTFSYTVSDGEGGTDIATVTITILGNDQPVALDDAYATNEDTPLLVAAPGVLANDTDPGDTLVVSDVGTSGTVGAVTLNADGNFTYNPNGKFESLAAGKTATDNFTYTVSDGKGGSDTATVTVTINGVNDAPFAVDDAYITNEDTSLHVAAPGLLANDTDPESDPLEVIVGGAGGADGELFVFKNGSFIFNPQGVFDYLAVGETTTDTFTYPVKDGKGGSDTAAVAITVNGVNDAPVAVDNAYATDEDTPLIVAIPGLLANDTDPDSSDVLTVSSVDTTGTLGTVIWSANGSFTYNPSGKFNELQAGDSAADLFSYTISDGHGGTDTAVVTITVNGLPNNSPVANDDVYGTDKANPLIVIAPGLLANDSDPDSTDVLSVTSVNQDGTVGVVIFNPNGSFAYDPNGKFDYLQGNDVATDTFTYTLRDGEGGTDTATVTIRIKASPNTPPVAVDDSYATNKATPLTLAAGLGLLVNDSDVDAADVLQVINLDTSGTLGEVTWNADGSFTYDPNGKFDSLGVAESATDSFVYTISDGFGGTDTATATITVNGEAVQVSQVVINGGSVQRSMITGVSVSFNADVAIAAGAFQLINRGTSDVVATSFTTSLVNGKTVATFSFLQGPSVQVRPSGNSLMDGNYQLTIDATKVTRNGKHLDGDGQGGDYVFGEVAVDKFFRFFGDVLGQDRLVGVPDFNTFRSAFGKSVGNALYRSELDFNGDGVIGVGDFNQFRARFGKSLGY